MQHPLNCKYCGTLWIGEEESACRNANCHHQGGVKVLDHEDMHFLRSDMEMLGKSSSEAARERFRHLRDFFADLRRLAHQGNQR